LGPEEKHIMDPNNFTEKSREALTEAQNIGTRLRHQAVEVEHLLLALLEQQGGLVRSLFEKAKVAPDFLKALIEVRGNQRVTSANPEATYEALGSDESSETASLLRVGAARLGNAGRT
jgi:ATP-dependent Clp protease ATP-binding subunit ClpB